VPWLGVGAIVVDVTEQKRAAEIQAGLRRNAEEALRVRGDFLAVAAHELLTPLTPLSLHLQTMDRKLSRNEAVDPAVIKKALEHLDQVTSLVNDLVDVSRIEAGRLALHRSPTSLKLIVQEQAALLKDELHPIEVAADRDDLIVEGDRARLAQVVANLLRNAVKFSDGRVRVELRRRDDTAVLSVCDCGIGIPTDQQRLLFERFFRARNAPISYYGGLGLGLYITRDIVERHGGRISVESQVGKGSTFHVVLPLSRHQPRDMP
jgi:signal transduction histidine kinase